MAHQKTIFQNKTFPIIGGHDIDKFTSAVLRDYVATQSQEENDYWRDYFRKLDESQNTHPLPTISQIRSMHSTQTPIGE